MKITKKLEKGKGVKEKRKEGNFMASFLDCGQNNGILPILPIISNSNVIFSAQAGLSPGDPDQD